VLGSTAITSTKALEARSAWGFEVSVPKGFDYMQSRGSFAIGKTRPAPRRRKAVSASARHIVLSRRANGPAFLLTENYAVLKEYNNSEPMRLPSAISPTE